MKDLKMVFQLIDLPYSKKALEPYISEKTFDFHHGFHHAGYVNNLNNLIKDTDFSGLSLEEIIKKSSSNVDTVAIFNNAAQVWNHNFFWHSIKANGGGKPDGKISSMIDDNFGSFEKFSQEFKQAGLSQFGSGWVWLVQDGKSLKITKTSNADLPMIKGQNALITCDVWEHAYYLDYQNRRADFVQVFIDKLINWDFANSNLI
jgi:superoxide dismutase, Fe-Mn family